MEKTLAHWPRSAVLLYEGEYPGGDFGKSFAAGLQSHGCEVTFAPRDGTWGRGADLVLAYGPFSFAGSMLPVAQRLLAHPRRSRPVFVWWLTEGIPPPGWPIAFVRTAARLRIVLDRSVLHSSPALWNKGHRLRVLGELLWLRDRGVLDVLTVTSASRAGYLRQFGFVPVVAPLGYHRPSYGMDMGLPRDVPVCFLGNPASPRRSRLLRRVTEELQDRGIPVLAQENLYGEERANFLNRSRIMLNILRAPQDFVGQRFLLGAANKTLVVSEPIWDSEPFVAGRHLAVAPLERLAATVEHYLAHEDERQRMVDAAHRLVTQELTIERMVGRILERARAVRERQTGFNAPTLIA